MESPYPTFDEILDSKEVDDLFQIRRSMRSVISQLCWFIVSVILVVFLNMEFLSLPLPLRLLLVSPRWLGIIPGLLLLNIIRKYHDDLYVFGKYGVTHYQGRLSLHSSVPFVKFADIRALRVKQNIWGRIFDYGNVELDTAADDDVELTLRAIPNPAALAELIEELRHNNITVGGAPAAESPTLQTTEVTESKS